MDTLLTMAAYYGIEVRTAGGSHFVFSYPGMELALCVPSRRPIKPVYIKQFVALVDQVRRSHS